MSYLADTNLRRAAERYGLERTMACRTLYQLVELYKAGLVTEAVGKRAEALMKECPQELLRIIAQELRSNQRE